MNKKVANPQTASPTMETLHELLKPHLNLPKARLHCFLMLVLAVIGQRTVSLVWLARHAETTAKAESVYRRFQRFFALCVLPARTVGKLILALSPKPHDGWVLAMDRTNWQFGKSYINLLVVSIINNGVGLPIVWRMLPKSTKCGNSRHFHRVAIMREVLAILPSKEIRVLTMDRELVGGLPATWWRERKRWKKHASQLHEVFGGQFHFAAKRIRNVSDAFLAVISHGLQGEEALLIYRMRWGIESLFSHLRKRGYQFEDTHMTKGCRIEKLMGVLAVAFALCYQWGQKLEKAAGMKLKSHGHRAKSVFRQGLESLHQMLRSPTHFADLLAEFFYHVIRRPLLEKFVV